MNKLTLGILGLIACAVSGSAFAGTPVQVPEPGTLGLLAAGIAAVVAIRLRGKK
jgi:PEP-CTERM motif